MITITYSLTPADLEEARNRTVGQRVARMAGAVAAGLLGLLFIYGQIRLFRGWGLFWRFWPANLIASVVALCLLWAATDGLGLQWFLQRYAGVLASREACFTGDTIATISRGKKQTLRWLRDRGWIETPNLFLLPIWGSEARFLVPKRAFTPDQERDFRQLLDPPKEAARFVIDFFLTEDDVKEVISATPTWLATTPGRLAGRAICFFGAVFLLLAPGLNLFSDVQGGWGGMWRTYPLGTVFLVVFCLLELWVAAGQVGTKRLVRYLNHHEQRRIYTFSDSEIDVRRGDKNRRHLWKCILDFRETPSAFVLRKHFLGCFIIPKSALEAYDVEEFRRFLLTKLLPSRPNARQPIPC